MALVTCPDCGKQISDAAAVCIGCGRPMRGDRAPVVHEVSAAVPRSGYACPRCGSDLVTLRALHEAGGAPAFAAPPDRDAMAPMSMLGCMLALIAGAATGAVVWYYYGPIWSLLAFFLSIKLFGRLARMQARPSLDAQHRAAMERWERRHLCTGCGAQVVRTENGSLEVEDADAEIDALLRAGQKIEAIKRMRDRTGLGLKEAKDAVEAREKKL